MKGMHVTLLFYEDALREKYDLIRESLNRSVENYELWQIYNYQLFLVLFSRLFSNFKMSQLMHQLVINLYGIAFRKSCISESGCWKWLHPNNFHWLILRILEESKKVIVPYHDKYEKVKYMVDRLMNNK